MINLKNLTTNDLDILCDNAGIDMATTNLLIAKFIKFVPDSAMDCAEWIYQVVASEDGDSNICICELSVTVDCNGDLVADFAGTPLFESNDMSAITDVWNDGPVVTLGDDFNPLDLVGMPEFEDVEFEQKLISLSAIPPTEFLKIR